VFCLIAGDIRGKAQLREEGPPALKIPSRHQLEGAMHPPTALSIEDLNTNPD